MSPWLVYALGVVTLPALWLMLVAADAAQEYIRREWISTIKWRDDRQWKRWEWGEAGRCLAFTPKHTPRQGIVVTLRPWRPIVPVRQPSMADDIHRIDLDSAVIDESYNVPDSSC